MGLLLTETLRARAEYPGFLSPGDGLDRAFETKTARRLVAMHVSSAPDETSLQCHGSLGRVRRGEGGKGERGPARLTCDVTFDFAFSVHISAQYGLRG